MARRGLPWLALAGAAGAAGWTPRSHGTAGACYEFWRTQDKNELDFVVDGRYGFEVKASPQTFSPARYNAFTARNPEVGIDVVSFDGFEEGLPFRVWAAWGL